MTRPRQVLPARYYLITRRCTQRQFLLTPDSSEITNAIAYCLADAASRFQIDVLITTVEANHHHTVIYDEKGRFPRFIEHFHKMVAKCINARRGHRENLWAPGQATVTELLDYRAVLKALAYTAANPVKDGLVERATQWPGLNGYAALINKTPIKTHRPRFFFRNTRRWAAELTLTFGFPEKLGDHAEILAELKSRVEVYEAEARQQRRGRGVIGLKAIRQQSWLAAPRSVEAPRTIRPRFAGRGRNIAKAVDRYKTFLEAYRQARKSWVKEGTGDFPPGTYWLARFTSLARLAPEEDDS